MRREGPNPATAAAASARKAPWEAPRLRLILGGDADGAGKTTTVNMLESTYTNMSGTMTYVYMVGS